MAISENRIKFDKIRSLTSLEFDSKADVTNKNPTNTTIAGATLSSSKTSVFDKKSKTEVPSVDKALGNFDPDDNSIDVNMPKLLKESLAKVNIDTSLSVDKTNGFLDNLSPIDIKLSTVSTPIPVFQPIKSVSEGKIDSLISNLSKSVLGNEFKKSMDPNRFKAMLKNNLASVNSITGPALGARNSIANIAESCGYMNNALNFNLTGLFGSIFFGTLFDSILCMVVDAVLGFIQNVLKIDPINSVPILNGLANSLRKDKDKSVNDKLMIMGAIKSNTPGTSNDIYTKGIAVNINKTTKDSEPETNSMSSEYKNVTESLDTLDPDWDKDNDGNRNLSMLKGNKRFHSLAANNNKNTVNESETFDGSASTNLNRSNEIAVLNAF